VQLSHLDEARVEEFDLKKMVEITKWNNQKYHWGDCF